MPKTARQAQQWLNKAEDTDRKNGRVCDKVMIALPKELTAKQQHEAIREFAEEVTQGRASWFAAFHTKDKDKNNPHAHVVIRDRDSKTGKRVFETTEKGSTERMRELWQNHANTALERAGHKERVDHRTLKEQGIERTPQIHEGVQARQMRKRGAEFKSKVIQFPNAATAKSKGREVDYTAIDNGKTRAEYNAEIVQLKERKQTLAKEGGNHMGMKEKIKEQEAKLRVCYYKLDKITGNDGMTETDRIRQSKAFMETIREEEKRLARLQSCTTYREFKALEQKEQALERAFDLEHGRTRGRTRT